MYIRINNIKEVLHINIRSKRYKNIINTTLDKEVKLIHKITNEEYYPMYQNAFGRVYYWTEDDDIDFIAENKIDNYKIIDL